MVMPSEWKKLFLPNYYSANESEMPEGYYLLEEQPERLTAKERKVFSGVTTRHAKSHSPCGL